MEQVSIFSGDVAFQNLDLRLSALEKDLDLPFKFISGHVHELSIHIPWVKLAYEPIVISINTIEFVVQLRDSNDLPTKSAVKDIPVPLQEPPPGYLASLVTKIANNISIKCNNIILKYVEEEIVLSCNIQELSLSSADFNWLPAFVDVSPIKFLVRKLVNINDLTICLDKRNSMGKIEVCLEPILYRCSLEARIVTKYNFSTRERTSLNRIDIFTKFLDINISTDQFSMLRRLMELLAVLPEKKSDLDTAIQRATNEEDETPIEEQAEGFVTWLWNQMPAIFSEESNASLDGNSDDEEHIVHFGAYIDTIKVMFKAQELISETVVGGIKKLKFIPLMQTEFQGTYLDSIRIGKTWHSTQGGVSNIKCTFLSDCPCKSSTTMSEGFYFVTPINGDTYLKDSLFDPNSPENQGMQCKYTANWTSHMESESESKLLEKTGAIAIDIVEYLSPSVSIESSDVSFGSGYEVRNDPNKQLIRAFIGPFCLKYCPDMIHRLRLIASFLESYKYPPYIEPKAPPSRSSIAPLQDDDIDFVLKGFPIQVISITIIKPSIQIHLWDHCSQGKSERRKLVKRSLNKLFFPFVTLTTERIESQIQYPVEPKLVPTLCQMSNISEQTLLAEAPFRRLAISLEKTTGSLNFAGHSSNILEINLIEMKAKELLQPQLWINNDCIKLNADLIFKSITLKVNPAQLCLLSSLAESNMNHRYIDVIHTNLLADISNDQLVHLSIVLDQLLAGYDKTDDYQIFQLEAQKINGYASIPALALQTHVFQWPNSKAENVPNLLSVVLQLPLHPEAKKHPSIIDIRMDHGGICIDSLFSRFLNYDLKRWSQPVYDTINVSSKSDTAAVIDTPIKKRQYMEQKKPMQALASVHSSSDRDAGTSVIVELETEEQDKQAGQLFELLKHLVIQVDIGETIIYFPTKCMTQSIFNEGLSKKLSSFKDNDVVILG